MDRAKRHLDLDQVATELHYSASRTMANQDQSQDELAKPGFGYCLGSLMLEKLLAGVVAFGNAVEGRLLVEHLKRQVLAILGAGREPENRIKPGFRLSLGTNWRGQQSNFQPASRAIGGQIREICSTNRSAGTMLDFRIPYLGFSCNDEWGATHFEVFSEGLVEEEVPWQINVSPSLLRYLH